MGERRRRDSTDTPSHVGKSSDSSPTDSPVRPLNRDSSSEEPLRPTKDGPPLEKDFPSLSELPFPIAYPAERVLSERTAQGRLDAILAAYLGLTRFLAIVGLAWYLRGDKATSRSGSIQKILSSEMSDGRWFKLLRETLRPYALLPLEFFVPELAEFFFNPASGQVTSSARDFEKWVTFRNNLRHVSRVRSLEPTDTLARRWNRQLGKTLTSFSVLSGYDLIQPIDVSIRTRTVQSARLFRGPSRNVRFLEGLGLTLTVDGVEREESILLVRRSDPSRQHLLSPFIRVNESDTLEVFNQVNSFGRRFSVQYVKAEDGHLSRCYEDGLHNPQLLEDFRSLMERLGGSGSSYPKNRTPAPASPYPKSVLRQWATVWARDGYEYETVLGLKREEDLKEAISTPSLWKDTDSVDVEAFLLVAAIHFRLRWRYWAKRNRKNRLAIEKLLGLLDEEEGRRFHRPRLRALYALQSVEKSLLKQLLEESKLPAGSIALVNRWVLSGQMKEYLRRLAGRAGPFPLPQRAAEVLSEIEPTGIGGLDLPVDPDTRGETDQVNR